MITIALYTILISVGLLIILLLLCLAVLYQKRNPNSPSLTITATLLFFLFFALGLTLILLLKPTDLSPYISDSPINLNESLKTLAPVTYYSYSPNSKTLTKLNLSKTIGNGQLADYFHKNDESLFVLKDGTIVSILGNSTRKFNTLPNAQKIRIVNNQYVALANGKLYTSKNLKDWTLDGSKPIDIVDIDVPAQQSNYLHIQTPKENLVVDVLQNKVVSSSKPETKKYGSSVNHFVRLADSGVYLHDKYFQKGYDFADIDHYNQIYLVPKNVSGYEVNDLHSSDKLAIVGLKTNNGPNKINVADQIQFYK